VTAIAQVQTSAASIQGTLTASQPLPYSVTIGLPGKPGDVTLQPGQTSVSFNFSLAQLNAEEASRAVAGYALANWRGAASGAALWWACARLSLTMFQIFSPAISLT
jgi:hypothetical protein